MRLLEERLSSSYSPSVSPVSFSGVCFGKDSCAQIASRLPDEFPFHNSDHARRITCLVQVFSCTLTHASVLAETIWRCFHQLADDWMWAASKDLPGKPLATRGNGCTPKTVHRTLILRKALAVSFFFVPVKGNSTVCRTQADRFWIWRFSLLDTLALFYPLLVQVALVDVSHFFLRCGVSLPSAARPA